MKKFIASFAVALTFFSFLCASPALAASASVEIKGPAAAAGGTYTYSVSVSAGASAIIVTGITCGGAFSGDKTVCWAQSGSGRSEQITAMGSITVYVSPDAAPRDKGTITVTYQISTYDGNKVSLSEGSETKDFYIAEKGGQPGIAPAPGLTEWSLAVEGARSLRSGGSLTLNISGNASAPKALFSALKDRQGVLTLGFSDYSCTINGAALADIPKGIDSIDLSLDFDADARLSKAVNGADLYQLHFAQTGDFPGVFTFSFKADKHKTGDMLYLYRYYEWPNISEGVESAVVAADGTVSFDFYSCHAYFITGQPIAGAAGEDFITGSGQSQLEAQLKQALEKQAELSAQLKSAQGTIPNPETSDGEEGISPATLAAAAVAAAALAALLTVLLFKAGLFKKRDKNNIA